MVIGISPPRRVRIPLRAAVAHASAEHLRSDSILVTARRGDLSGLGEGCPRPYVTGETSESAQAWIEAARNGLEQKIGSLADVRRWMSAHADALRAHPAAWCAVELACLDLFAREQAVSIERLLGLDDAPREFRYSAVLGPEEYQSLERMTGRYVALGLNDFKLRPTGDATRRGIGPGSP